MAIELKKKGGSERLSGLPKITQQSCHNTELVLFRPQHGCREHALRAWMYFDKNKGYRRSLSVDCCSLQVQKDVGPHKVLHDKLL